MPELWTHLALRAAARIRKKYGAPDRTTAERMVRAFRAALFPRRRAGRKPDETTARAAELFTAGMRAYTGARTHRLLVGYQRRLWQRIYPEVYPDLAREDHLTRQYRTSTLRRNVKSLLHRRDTKGRRHLRPHTNARG